MTPEESLIRAFIERGMRKRYLEKLTKDRIWVLDRIDHMLDLDWRYEKELTVPNDESGVALVYDLLRSKGARDTCYVLGGRGTRWKASRPAPRA
jgi:hypothetical protein